LLSSFRNDSAQETIRSRLQLFKSLPLSKPYIRNSHTAPHYDYDVFVFLLAVARSRRQLSRKFSEDEETPGKLIVIIAVVWPGTLPYALLHGGEVLRAAGWAQDRITGGWRKPAFGFLADCRCTRRYTSYVRTWFGLRTCMRYTVQLIRQKAACLAHIVVVRCGAVRRSSLAAEELLDACPARPVRLNLTQPCPWYWFRTSGQRYLGLLLAGCCCCC
jgi:hypothetical protein